MADEKKKKVKVKVKYKSGGKYTAEIDNALDTMSKQFIDKPVTGEMDYFLKKQNGNIVTNEYSMSDSLITAGGYAELGSQIQELALADLEGVTDGRIKIIFETQFDESIG